MKQTKTVNQKCRGLIAKEDVFMTMKLNEQIAFLRKKHGYTQEELATALGVTNQSVSKWESAQCCPDIQLLPEIAKFFRVTVDELLGYQPAEGLNDICLKIRRHFTELPEKHSFENAYRLAALLHEIALTDGYKNYYPWEADKDYSAGEVTDWGMSASLEPEGCTIRKGNCLFFSLDADTKEHTIAQLTDLKDSMDKISVN